MGTLYIVSTPIGNRQDITVRALRKLFEVGVIVCEDTRVTGNLMGLFRQDFATLLGEKAQNKPVLVSFFEQNEKMRIPQIISFLERGEDIALVSDAGTPTISDPGFRLVRECVEKGIRIEALPGVSAAVTALSVSGLPTDKFLFVGYPPQKPGHRKTFFENIKASQESVNSTVILYESPYKLMTTLSDMLEVLGDIDIVICRELTKLHEEKRHEKISHAIEHFKKQAPKGEFVLLLHF